MDSQEKVPLMQQSSFMCDPNYTSVSMKEEYPQLNDGGGGHEFSAFDSVTKKDTTKNPAKKKSSILTRDVMVKNPDDVNIKELLSTLVERFTKNYWKWRRRATVFKFANLTVTILLIAIQLSQLTIMQISVIDLGIKMAISTIFPAVTAAILGIQQKLKWAEKAAKSKKSAVLCKKLREHAQYRLDLLEAGAVLEDPIKLWNASMHLECTELPAFLMAY